MPQSIGTIPIASLPPPGLGMAVAFRIPAYQRGYRWKKDDVTRLLTDLKEFLDEGKTGRPFYCLQPLVVKKVKRLPDDASSQVELWEVVDGQQRLTTLFLLWKFLNGQPPYSLVYVTRERSKHFLDSISEKTQNEVTNIDFHHIYHAYLAIQHWFNNNSDQQDHFRKLLADSKPNGRNVRLIWYEIGVDDDAVAAFTRLNVGKIPLTDEELIRALFLRNHKGGTLADAAFQHRLALEWDMIETSLQAPDFWGFVSNQTGPEGGRIRLLFELCAPEGTSIADHGIFQHYEARLKGASPKELRSEWQRIVSHFELLQEWYRVPELFHLIGFLATILEKGDVSTLRKRLTEASHTTKPVFAKKLRSEIRKALIGGAKTVNAWVSELDYQENSKRILPVLALFNIATLLQTKSVQSRFPFHLFHGNAWDLEHVQSQAGDGLGDRKLQLEWLKACEDELVKEANPQCQQMLEEIRLFRNNVSGLVFEDLEKAIRECFEERDSNGDLHGIGNLTLLDSSTNRAYGNAPFVVKRAQILEEERLKGTFILPCTRDLFLKVFSKDPGNLRRWDLAKDGASHEVAICEALESFFSGKGGAES